MRYLVYKDDTKRLRVAMWDVPLLTHDNFCRNHGIDFHDVTSCGRFLFSRTENEWKIYDEASWLTPPHDLTKENGLVLKQIKARFEKEEALKDRLSAEWEAHLKARREWAQKRAKQKATESLSQCR